MGTLQVRRPPQGCWRTLPADRSDDRNPEIHLHREEIVLRSAERVERVGRPDRANAVFGAIAVLLPDDEQRAAGPPLPAHDRVAAETALVEVRISEGDLLAASDVVRADAVGHGSVARVVVE